MPEYIEREAVRKVLRGSAVAKYPISFYVGLFAAADEVEKMPAADVAPVVHGKWLDSLDENGLLCNAWRKCSVCGCLNYSKKPPYCPNCGARMDGE